MPGIMDVWRRLTGQWKDAGHSEPIASNIGTTERPTDPWASMESAIEISGQRKDKYKDYEEMDKEIDELSSSLDLYADFIVSGGESAEDVYSIDVETDKNEPIIVGADGEPQKKKEKEHPANVAIKRIETKLNLKSRVWFMARNVAKYGDAFYEVVVDANEVCKLVYLKPQSMEVNRDEKTKDINPNFPYVQKTQLGSSQPIPFAPWEIVHFKAGEGDYGVDYSILGKCRRSYRIVRMMEDSVLVARLTRANNRMVYYVDVSNMGVQEGLKYLEKLKALYKTRRYTDGTGKLKIESNPLQPQEDIWLPVRKDKSTRVEPISGDAVSMRGIADVEHFHNKLFAATKVPKAYLGFEKTTSGKATLSQQHLSFSKSVRRFRHVLATGLRHMYKVEFIMLDIDPNSFTWNVKFPGLGTADEEMRWAIESIKASVIAAYTNAGIQLPVEWIIRHLFLDLSPNEEDELLAALRDEKSLKTSPQMPGLTPMEPARRAGAPTNGKPPSDAAVESALELLRQDKDMLDGFERWRRLRRTGEIEDLY